VGLVALVGMLAFGILEHLKALNDAGGWLTMSLIEASAGILALLLAVVTLGERIERGVEGPHFISLGPRVRCKFDYHTGATWRPRRSRGEHERGDEPGPDRKRRAPATRTYSQLRASVVRCRERSARRRPATRRISPPRARQHAGCGLRARV
jgi:hypothetical protein